MPSNKERRHHTRTIMKTMKIGLYGGLVNISTFVKKRRTKETNKTAKLGAKLSSRKRLSTACRSSILMMCIVRAPAKSTNSDRENTRSLRRNRSNQSISTKFRLRRLNVQRIRRDCNPKVQVCVVVSPTAHANSSLSWSSERARF